MLSTFSIGKIFVIRTKFLNFWLLLSTGVTSFSLPLIQSMDTFDNCFCVLINIISVLSSFSINFFFLIHAWMAQMQFLMVVTASSSFDLVAGLNDRYICVSSAYTCTDGR